MEETHHGMDIGAAYGDPITAALDGYVEYVGYSDIWKYDYIKSWQGHRNRLWSC